MSIEELDVVDVLSTDPRSGRGVLTVSDHLDWAIPHEHLQLLQSKLNRYIAFIHSGEAKGSWKHSPPMYYEIEVVFQFDPPPDATEFLTSVGEFLSSHGIFFSFRVFREH